MEFDEITVRQGDCQGVSFLKETMPGIVHIHLCRKIFERDQQTDFTTGAKLRVGFVAVIRVIFTCECKQKGRKDGKILFHKAID